ncbi:MAG: DDE-type integrase/transposase/recombinase [Candidatus Thiodiazotropha sp. (ex Lucinoma aequizonata)]|nr:DDE-type integrase/transposase/recombinase [Candidatus Thiodiazotropha sp. (ex Lucinoma aequizonata)]
MGFGLCNAPATFARVINLVLRGLNWKTVLAFLDDILVMGRDFDDHLLNLREALTRFRQYGLKLKPKKCIFFQKRVEFLGRFVSQNTLEMAQRDIKVVQQWPVPKCTKDVERFLGLVNYHRVFIKDFAGLAVPLYQITGKKKYTWGDEQEAAFVSLKEALLQPSVLALPNQVDDFVLDTDASDTAVGAELLQIQNGEEKVIAFGSFALTPEQRRYCTTRKELLAVVRFTRQYRHYLLGRPFLVRTDHNSLTWLLRFKEPQGQLARWIEELSQYNMILRYRKGRHHANADALSRVPSPGFCEAYVVGIRLPDLPCGGCHYCARADQQWSRFSQEVDDVVKLSQRGAVATDDTHEHWERGGDLTESVKGSGLAQSDRPDSNCDTGDNYPIKLDSHVGVEEIELEDKDPNEPLTIRVLSSIPEIELVDSYGKVAVRNLQIGDEHTCWGLSLTEIKEAQGKDPDFGIILDWLSTSADPSEGALFLASPCAKFCWINKARFQLGEGILYCTQKDTEDWNLVLPSSLRSLALELNHDLPSAGHQGVARTLSRVKEKFWWYGMSQDIRSYVATCSACNQNKKNVNYGRVPMTEYHAGAPMERVHIDFMGPLPKTNPGNEHILMMVDQFTKWVEVVPVPSQTAEVTAHAAVGEFFARFGYPLQLFSDQGRNFESKLFTALCEVLHIHKKRTTPYRPSSNGQVERYNKTLMDAVRCFIGKRQHQWDVHLPQLAGALRAAVNRNTGFTANKLMLGREVNLPSDLVFSSSSKDTGLDENTYINQLVENMRKAHESARSTLKTTQRVMKRNYDLRVLQRTYEEGDAVYILDTAVTKGKSRKLCPPWKGPGIIAKKITPSLFRVKFKNAIFTTNHDRMKPCRDRELPRWLLSYRSNTEKEADQTVDDNTVYCVCRKPWGKQFMIRCDYCNEWYHGSCVDITPTEALNIDKYRCSQC